MEHMGRIARAESQRKTGRLTGWGPKEFSFSSLRSLSPVVALTSLASSSHALKNREAVNSLGLKRLVNGNLFNKCYPAFMFICHRF